MTPQERQLVDELFDRLSKMENTPRDSDAAGAIAQGLRIAPNAIYPLVQTVLVQDEALRRANSRIQELEAQSAPQQSQGGGFLDTMRGALFGQGQSQGSVPQGSVPNVRPPEAGSRPVWNSGQVLQQAGQYDQGGYGQHDQGGYGQPYGGPQAPGGGGMMGGGTMGGGMGGGGGGSFLGTAAAAAAGVVGGSLLLNSIRSMMGGGHQAFGGTALADRATSSSPWTDQSNSNLARDAGINDIGSRDLAAQDYAQDLAQDREDDDVRAADERDDLEADANDDFGGDNDSDFA
jgi:hypothetical protein